MLERMWSKGNTPPLLVEMQICTSTLEINMAVSQKIGNQPTSGPAIPFWGIYPKDAQSYYKDIYSTMFKAALFIIVVKNNDILKFVCKWMKLDKTS